MNRTFSPLSSLDRPMTPEQRKELARRAVQARWAKAKRMAKPA